MSLNEERTGPTAEALECARVRERTERMCGKPGGRLTWISSCSSICSKRQCTFKREMRGHVAPATAPVSWRSASRADAAAHRRHSADRMMHACMRNRGEGGIRCPPSMNSRISWSLHHAAVSIDSTARAPLTAPAAALRYTALRCTAGSDAAEGARRLLEHSDHIFGDDRRPDRDVILRANVRLARHLRRMQPLTRALTVATARGRSC
jgi:hypothetical protein